MMRTNNEKLDKKLSNNMRELLKTPAGRTVLYYIILMGVPRQGIFCGEDTHKTAFNCGLAAMSEMIKDFVKEISKTALPQMENEWNSMVTSLENEQSENEYE